VFSLETGRVLGGPPVHPVTTYQVKLDGDTILIAHEGGAREPAVS
jgi:nitrite reductase/ring-hydroxylating ferredoxin subunit